MKIDGYDKLMTLGQENADALLKSGNAALKGFEEMTRASQALATTSIEQFDKAVRELFACRSPVEVVDVQAKLARELVETAIAQSRKFSELAGAACTAAFEPLNARMTAFQTAAKSAA